MPDLDAIERQFRAHHVPQLRARLDGKLHADGEVRPKTPEEIARDARLESAREETNKARAALVKAIAKEEGEWLETHVGKLLPDYMFKPAHRKARQGDGFDLRKLMNEYEIKVVQVQHPEMALMDAAAGIVRRNWQVKRQGKVIFEHMWEWTQV